MITEQPEHKHSLPVLHHYSWHELSQNPMSTALKILEVTWGSSSSLQQLLAASLQQTLYLLTAFTATTITITTIKSLSSY